MVTRLFENDLGVLTVERQGRSAPTAPSAYHALGKGSVAFAALLLPFALRLLRDLRSRGMIGGVPATKQVNC